MTQKLSLLLCLVLAASALHAGQPVVEKAPDPDEEKAAFVVADGFEINLFAADPQMAKPTHMNFDPQGRLWVASSETYPQVKPGIVPNDKIIMLEDTTGKGVADKFTVYADHLFIPTGVLPGDGGVYVSNSTELLHFIDTNGDGVADQRRVVLSGFGTEDTHHILHTLRWGMDGRMFMNQSIYIHSHVETPFGVKRLNAGGTWRFKPDTMELEVFTRGLVNHWGHVFTKWGESLGTDGAGGEGVNFFFHGATFVSGKEADGSNPKRLVHGMTPGSPKYASIEIISGRHFPDDWQGDVITNDFRASRIVRFKLTEEGSGFTAKLQPDFLTYRPEAKKPAGKNSVERVFRPIDVKMGPDGALYIADWYNPIINHGEVDFFDPRRDHTHGRIWRVTAKGRPLVERPKLIGASIPELLEKFKAPEDYTRAQARRVLIEKGPQKVLPALGAFVASTSDQDQINPENERYRLEALWLYQAFNSPEVSLLKDLLTSREPHVRAAATRVLRDWYPSVPEHFELLKKLIDDPSPRVRLEAITALENIPDSHSIEIALGALNKPQDANITFALHHAANGLKAYWLADVESGKSTFNGNVAALSFALQSVGSKAGVSTLFTLFKEKKIAPENQDNVIGLIAGMGGAPELTELFNFQSSSTDAGQRAKVLNALERTVSERHVKFGVDGAAFAKLFTHSDASIAAASLRLAGALKLEKQRADIDAVLNAPTASDAAKSAALDALASLGGPKSVASINAITKANTSLSVRAHAAANLVAFEPKAAVEASAALLSQKLDAVSATEVFSAFAKKKGAGAQLAEALSKAKPEPDNAEAGLRYFNASGQNEPELLKLLKSSATQTSLAAGASTSPNLPGKKPVELVASMNADDMKALLADVLAHGDPARGERIFRSKTLSCFSCHALGGAGGQVGPDMSNVGSASPLDYIADSVLFPNKTVKEGYNAVTVWTKDDEVTTGIVVRQSATHLILRDGTREEIPIPLSEIAKKKESGSLMPNGLADNLSRGEFADLVRFLSELGKPGPYTMAQSLAIRRYRVLDPVADELAAAPDAELPKLLSTAQNQFWMPAYAEVSGNLSTTELVAAKNKPVALVRFELECSTPGKIALKFNSTKGISAWVDGAPFDPSTGTVELTKGTRTITLRVDKAARGNDPLKIDAEEAPGSAARFTRVGGK